MNRGLAKTHCIHLNISEEKDVTELDDMETQQNNCILDPPHKSLIEHVYRVFGGC